MIFPVVMYGCESWTEELRRRLSAEELMLLNCGVGEDSWTARGSNQSILKEISPGCFPVVMYGHESWTVKKAECRRIDASELWR